MKIATAAITVLLLVSGCSSGDDAVSPLPTAAVDNSIAETETSPSEPEAAPERTTTSERAAAPTLTAAPTPTTARTTTPTDAAESPEVAVADAIRRYFAVRLEGNAAPTPNPDHPGFAEVATGDELASLIANTQRRLDEGLALRAGQQELAEVRVGSVGIDESVATAA